MNLTDRYVNYKIKPPYVFIRVDMLDKSSIETYAYSYSGKLIVAYEVKERYGYEFPSHRFKYEKHGFIKTETDEYGQKRGKLLDIMQTNEKPANWNEYLEHYHTIQFQELVEESLKYIGYSHR
jgi:hypothetical protein